MIIESPPESPRQLSEFDMVDDESMSISGEHQSLESMPDELLFQIFQVNISCFSWYFSQLLYWVASGGYGSANHDTDQSSIPPFGIGLSAMALSQVGSESGHSQHTIEWQCAPRPWNVDSSQYSSRHQSFPSGTGIISEWTQSTVSASNAESSISVWSSTFKKETFILFLDLCVIRCFSKVYVNGRMQKICKIVVFWRPSQRAFLLHWCHVVNNCAEHYSKLCSVASCNDARQWLIWNRRAFWKVGSFVTDVHLTHLTCRHGRGSIDCRRTQSIGKAFSRQECFRENSHPTHSPVSPQSKCLERGRRWKRNDRYNSYCHRNRRGWHPRRFTCTLLFDNKGSIDNQSIRSATLISGNGTHEDPGSPRCSAAHLSQCSTQNSSLWGKIASISTLIKRCFTYVHDVFNPFLNVPIINCIYHKTMNNLFKKPTAQGDIPK